MATIKSYTDLEQSKKLAEILPPESADMLHCLDFDRNLLATVPKQYSGSFRHQPKLTIPCWSLAALLNILPTYELNNFGNAIQLAVKNEALETEGDETLLDLVVNMIIHLHEHKKL